MRLPQKRLPQKRFSQMRFAQMSLPHGRLIACLAPLALSLVTACSSESAASLGDYDTGSYGYPSYDDDDDGASGGAIGVGGFTYLCTDTNDAQCSPAIQSKTFPQRVALESRFEVRYYLPGTEPQREGIVTPTSTNLLDGEWNVFVARNVGRAAFVVRDSARGDVRDYLDVTIIAPSRIEIVDDRVVADGPYSVRRPPPERILSVGAERPVRALLVDENGNWLAGSMSGFTWQSSDPDVIDFLIDPSRAATTIRAFGTGEATLTVSIGDLTQSYAIRVATPGGPLPPSDDADADDDDVEDAGDDDDDNDNDDSTNNTDTSEE